MGEFKVAAPAGRPVVRIVDCKTAGLGQEPIVLLPGLVFLAGFVEEGFFRNQLLFAARRGPLQARPGAAAAFVIFETNFEILLGGEAGRARSAQSSAAMIVADRGDSSSAAISPKHSPAPSWPRAMAWSLP